MKQHFRELSAPEKIQSFEEEARAWKHGAILAAEVGFDDWDP